MRYMVFSGMIYGMFLCRFQKLIKWVTDSCNATPTYEVANLEPHRLGGVLRILNPITA